MSATEKIKLGIHPAAAIFPLQSDEELAELSKSIMAHGLRERITIISEAGSGDWLVLDGRNRLEALRRMNMTDKQIMRSYVRVITQKELDSMNATPEEYVLMANIERRNLTQAQRRELAGKLAVMLEQKQIELEPGDRQDTLSLAASKAGVSRRTAATAKALVQTGEPTKRPAKKKAAGPKVTPIQAADRMRTIRDAIKNNGHNWKGPELAAVDSLAGQIHAMVEKATESIKNRVAAEAAEKKKEAAKK